ncbi:MAG: hypothetical protein R3C28_18120 [Pirellulaceae bacterium]
MNQTPAAILVLASAVFCFAANFNDNRADSPTPTVFYLAGFTIGIWGVLALISAVVREREWFIDSNARLDVFDRIMVREPKVTRTVRSTAAERVMDLSPDVQAQLNVAAQMEGRERTDILEETLRRHLPKYSQTSRVA